MANATSLAGSVVELWDGKGVSNQRAWVAGLERETCRVPTGQSLIRMVCVGLDRKLAGSDELTTVLSGVLAEGNDGPLVTVTEGSRSVAFRSESSTMLEGVRGEEKKDRREMGKRQRFKSAQKLAYEQYLDSDHWAALRRSKLTLKPCCEVCLETYRLLHVHHVNYRDYYSCTVDDLVTLCERCHNDLHTALKEVRAQSCDYPLPLIGPLLRKYWGGELRREKRRGSKKAIKHERKKYTKQSRAFRKQVSRIINEFWQQPGIDSLVTMRDRLTEVINEHPTDVESVVLNHAAGPA